MWHYFVWQLIWLLLKKLGIFFPNHLVTLVWTNKFDCLALAKLLLLRPGAFP
jgi:hypothetical protein